LSCKNIIREVSDYLDGDLTEELRRELEAHLCKCRDCRVVVDTTRKPIELYCDGELFPLPPAVRARLRQALRRKCQPQTM